MHLRYPTLSKRGKQYSTRSDMRDVTHELVLFNIIIIQLVYYLCSSCGKLDLCTGLSSSIIILWLNFIVKGTFGLRCTARA